MKSDADWTYQVKGLLKGELKRRNVSYQGLSESLKAMGVEESAENIANKISRGKFTAVFFIQCLEVIGCKMLHLNDDV
jgi:hypothetical protein